MSDIVVVGSMNMDVTVRVAELPGPGQTVLGGAATYTCGGKGGNQAAASARLLPGGGRVRMVGLVGADAHGDTLVDDLVARGVDTSQVTRLDTISTGMAMICVDDAGENTIVVSPGANSGWLPEHLARVDVSPGDILVCQLEIPVWVVAEVVGLATARRARVILNAAPHQDLQATVLDGLSVLVVNETEAAQVLGTVPSSPAHLDDLCSEIGCDVVVTLGARGALARPAGGSAQHLPAFRVDAVSAVGAGDAFVGALAVGLAGGEELTEAVRRACAAGALAVAAPDARGGIPTAAELDAFLDAVTC